MTSSSFPNNDSNIVPVQPKISTTPPEHPAEIIRALTPILIAAIGGVIGLVVLFKVPDNQAGLGLASTAIAGAAGLAQPNREAKDK